MKYPIPDEALDDRLAYVGTSGSGKTYAAGTGVERLLARRSRAVIVDPLGVWYGLRLHADGKTRGFDVVIFGGPHGDLPLTEHAGALIGETVATMGESCIIDLSELPSKAAERRFMLAFLDAIYRKTDPRHVDPYHIVFDEADLWAPQKSSEPMLQSTPLVRGSRDRPIERRAKRSSAPCRRCSRARVRGRRIPKSSRSPSPSTAATSTPCRSGRPPDV